jgi:Zn-dependent protease/predicted transcriptional regulator
MSWSLTLGSVRGIRLKLHLTFVLLLAWAAYYWGLDAGQGLLGALFGIALTVLLFGCIVLHELVHSLVALQYGVRVREIELSPIGGVSKMESMPEEPYQEFVMALSGPLVNLLIAVPLGGVVLAMVASGFIRSFNYFFYLMEKPSWQGLILNLFVSNVALALFNLLPAFPMDGGRVLRSVLAFGLGQRRATRLAARLGQMLAVLMGWVGLFPPRGIEPNWVLVFIALFIFVGAQQEERMAEIQAVLDDLRVGQALITACQTLSPDDTLALVLEYSMRGHPACFGVVVGEQLVGLLNGADISSALEAYGPQVRVGDVMRKQFPSVATTDTLARAWQIMATSGQRALPVTEGGRWLGLLTAQQVGQIYTFLAAQQKGK